MTVQESFDHLVETVRGYNPSANFDLIRSAFEFADKAHEGQLRKDNSPFVTHPLAVAQIVAESASGLGVHRRGAAARHHRGHRGHA